MRIIMVSSSVRILVVVNPDASERSALTVDGHDKSAIRRQFDVGRVVIHTELQQTLDAHLADLGFARDTRAFKSHLTLGRVKGKIASDRMKAAIDKLKEFESEPFENKQIILFKSELRPGGAVYTRVQAIDFQGHQP